MVSPEVYLAGASSCDHSRTIARPTKTRTSVCPFFINAISVLVFVIFYHYLTFFSLCVVCFLGPFV